MQTKPTLQVVICQLQTTINDKNRKGDIVYTEKGNIVYTDYASYKTYFEQYASLIQSIDELFNKKYETSHEYIMIKPFPQPDVYKQLPTNLTSENLIQKIAQEIWNIPEEKVNNFEYGIYPN